MVGSNPTQSIRERVMSGIHDLRESGYGIRVALLRQVWGEPAIIDIVDRSYFTANEMVLNPITSVDFIRLYIKI